MITGTLKSDIAVCAIYKVYEILASSENLWSKVNKKIILKLIILHFLITKIYHLL